MKTLASLAVVAGLAAGAAHAQTITYTLSGTLTLNGGSDADGLQGASFSFTADYDSSGVYGDNFGLPMVVANSGTPTVTISGSSDGANNTSVGLPTDMAFYPTFAGTFTHPDGNHSVFNIGNGSSYTMQTNQTPAAGAGDVFIGGAIELDDFADGASYAAITILIGSAGSYELSNATITAVIPAPASIAALGLGGLVATRRRR